MVGTTKVFVTKWDFEAANFLGGNPLCSLELEPPGTDPDAPYWHIDGFREFVLNV